MDVDERITDNFPTRKSDDLHDDVTDTDSQPLIKKTKAPEKYKVTLPVNIRWFVYLSHLLSAWGDRMWQFGVGLFLLIIAPGSLRLTAIYGLCTGGATLIFGTVVGEWVDQTPRLRAARTTLILQNMSVLLCSGVVFAVITFREQLSAVWPNQGLLELCYGVIILLAVIASLASMGTTIAVERDWIVEICGRHTDILASMSATLRRIDLLTNIVAPIVTGQVMAYGSESIGALFIGGWNLVSVFVEYYLLWKVYDTVPALHDKKYRGDIEQEDNKSPEQAQGIDDIVDNNHDHQIHDKDTHTQEHNGDDKDRYVVESYDNRAFRNENVENGNGYPPRTEEQYTNEEYRNQDSKNENVKQDEKSITEKTAVESAKEAICCKQCGTCWRKAVSGVIAVGRGWRTYMKYDVAFAGLGLAALYMTVLGFDNVTVGYAYSQGVNESVMGILMAAGALIGILGTMLYPPIKRNLGLQRTGLLGLFLEVFVLCLCVLSIWAPGSPFDPFRKGNQSEVVAMETNGSLATNVSEFGGITLADDKLNLTYVDSEIGSNNTTEIIAQQISSSSSLFVTMATSNYSASADPVVDEGITTYLSVGVLMAGIIGARCGLWLTDLTVTQLFLESVVETERGVVNGVQMSLNMLMDMLKFLLVIIIPDPRDFGFLVLISFGFTVLGWVFYAKYSYSNRGHLFHVERLYMCTCVKPDCNKETAIAG